MQPADRPAPVDTGERTMPPLQTAGERTMLTGMLDWYREGVVHKVTGMHPDDLSASPVRSSTSVAGLIKHLAFVEDHWFTYRLAGQPLPEPWVSAPFDEDPDWEFHSADQSLAELLALYAVACGRSRAVTASIELEATVVDERGREFSLRFLLLHMVEETARHLGHLDVLRELLDGTTGD